MNSSDLVVGKIYVVKNFKSGIYDSSLLCTVSVGDQLQYTNIHGKGYLFSIIQGKNKGFEFFIDENSERNSFVSLDCLGYLTEETVIGIKEILN